MKRPAYRAALLAACLSPMSGTAFAEMARHDGVTLTIASQNDQFARVLAELAPQFAAADYLKQLGKYCLGSVEIARQHCGTAQV